MHKIETIDELRSHLAPARRAGRTIGLVPTMGALHEGHRSLMRIARRECQELVVSIFVNPTQFGPNEDYQRYPRPAEADLACCADERVDTVFMPSVDQMYPAGETTRVAVARLTEGLCGRFRPGHFDGVTTVVAKLFNIVQPDRAYFGQKDAQQAVVIRQMVRDLWFPLEIVVCPIIREPDGLAMSSRNVYLSVADRQQALCLFGSLKWAQQAVAAGQRDVATLVAAMRERIEAAGPCRIDYVDIVGADDLVPKTTVAGRCLIALAVHIGPARLIDNVIVEG